MIVRPKKHLGQHFLKDLEIAQKIADALIIHKNYTTLLEIGPGTGVLTQYLVKRDINFLTVEIDKESVQFLKQTYPGLAIIEGDFLKIETPSAIPGTFGIIGNFPYNISSQIFFKVLEVKEQVMELVCMLQKEVAQRIASPPGNKNYGILSVFLQAYYDIEYLFTVEPEVFFPPPKVKSGVIRLKRNEVLKLDCDETFFYKVVKQGFNNRRKTLRNALKPLQLSEEIIKLEILDKRAEQLSVSDFVNLTNLIQNNN